MGKLFYFSATLACLLFFAPAVFAQSIGVGQNPVQYIVSPEVPGPGDSAQIEIQGVGTFLGDATITWQVNGKTVLSGVGERKLLFTLGGLGTKTTVNVTIDSASQGTITKSFSFSPSQVNLLWEADTTVPPFYLGKALYSGGATLKILALPQVVVNGATLSTNSLSFQWTQNGTPIPDQSGAGKNSITVVGSQLLPNEDISVDVQLGGNTVGHGEVIIPAETPELLLYEQDALRGVLYDQALSGTASLTDKEITLKAEPYFFSKESAAQGNLLYTWKLNGNTTTGPDSASGLLTLRQSGSGAGQAALTVSLQNTDPAKYVEAANAALAILFGVSSDSANSSPFGL